MPHPSSYYTQHLHHYLKSLLLPIPCLDPDITTLKTPTAPEYTLVLDSPHSPTEARVTVVVWVVVVVTTVRWLMVVVTAVRWLVVVVTAVGWLVACTGSISLFIISLSFFSSLFSSTQHNIIPGMYSSNPPNFLSRVSVTLEVTLKSNAATLVFRNWCS